jgi:hypothetical protein
VIEPPLFDAISALGIGGLATLIALVFVAVFSRGRREWRRRLAAGVGAVMFASAWLAARGHLARFDVDPPPMAILMPSVLVMGFSLGGSRLGAHVATTVPLSTLIGLQGFRLPLELVMHRAASVGIMPTELSYSGYNLDILTGLGACVLFALMRAGVGLPRWVLWGWNVWGWWSLAVITVVAITSSPMVRLFGNDPRHMNTWVLYFPYVWLPVVLVTVALAGHVVITRALRASA